MAKNIYTRIIGTGSYLPPKKLKTVFQIIGFMILQQGELLTKRMKKSLKSFREITNIDERRYADDDQIHPIWLCLLLRMHAIQLKFQGKSRFSHCCPQLWRHK
jgi:hypothetical protein